LLFQGKEGEGGREGGGGALTVLGQDFQSGGNQVSNGGETEGGIGEEEVDVGLEEGVEEEGGRVCSQVGVFDQADGEEIVEFLGPF
jgi:hypothetical protein